MSDASLQTSPHALEGTNAPLSKGELFTFTDHH